MRAFILSIMGWVGGYFLGSMVFRILSVFGVTVSSWPVVFLLFPYVSAFLLAFALPVIDLKRKSDSS
ncbi:DUF5957 family protein [Evansella halocellulosilytica]|uniref:DUF5957 family protein n=1 Tax=Evansella halocellulosilytica TaxID=2011013 RepID=UPI000BB732A0